MEEHKMTLARKNEGLFPLFWNSFFENEWLDMPTGIDSKLSIPAVNIKDTVEGYEIEMAVPGMEKSDFSINLENGQLTIASEKKVETEATDKNESYARKEFSYSSFKRVFNLPDSAEQDRITAEYKNGILLIAIPKKEEAKPKPIKLIQVS